MIEFNLNFLSGFVDELEKISATTVPDVIKTVNPQKLRAQPKMVSKLPKSDLKTPVESIDHLGSNKTIQPPPVTAGGN